MMLKPLGAGSAVGYTELAALALLPVSSVSQCSPDDFPSQPWSYHHKSSLHHMTLDDHQLVESFSS